MIKYIFIFLFTLNAKSQGDKFLHWAAGFTITWTFEEILEPKFFDIEMWTIPPSVLAGFMAGNAKEQWDRSKWGKTGFNNNDLYITCNGAATAGFLLMPKIQKMQHKRRILFDDALLKYYPPNDSIDIHQ